MQQSLVAGRKEFRQPLYCLKALVVPVPVQIDFAGDSESCVIGRRRSVAVLAAQESARKRIVYDDSDTLIGAERQQFAFDLSKEKVVARLDRIEPGQMQAFARPQSPAQLPGGKIRAVDVSGLTALDYRFKRPQRLVDWSLGVWRMHLVQINIV